MTVYERLSLSPVQTVNNIEFHSLQLDKPTVAVKHQTCLLDDLQTLPLTILCP